MHPTRVSDQTQPVDAKVQSKLLSSCSPTPGAGEQREVVLTSQPGHPSLVVSNAARVKLSNLRLQQEAPCGAGGALVVVEAGEMTLDSCDLQGGVTGVCVHTGATLLMRSCEVSGAQVLTGRHTDHMI